jgi:predicted metal-binding protein
MSADLELFLNRALEIGAAEAKVIDPHDVLTGAWVKMKCQYGSSRYGTSWCCPPHSPTASETRQVLDGYTRGIIFRFSAVGDDYLPKLLEFHDAVRDMETDLFKAGYYKAFAYLSGPCMLCQKCALLADARCTKPARARPSMEASGIDVFGSVRSAGFTINTLSERGEESSRFCMILVD